MKKGPSPKKQAAKPRKKRSAKPQPKAKNKAAETAPAGLTAEAFIRKLKTYQSEKDRQDLQRYFKTGKGEYGEGDQFMGVRMGQVFTLAKGFTGMPLNEIEKLLESPVHEARAGAVSIMDIEARRKKRRKAAERNSSGCTCDDTTASTTGTWSTARRRM